MFKGEISVHGSEQLRLFLGTEMFQCQIETFWEQQYPVSGEIMLHARFL